MSHPVNAADAMRKAVHNRTVARDAIREASQQIKDERNAIAEEAPTNKAD